MCGKPVADTNVIVNRLIDGKEHEFDSVDCANIYERLVTIYGTSLEI
jgi:hypothetical protein